MSTRLVSVENREIRLSNLDKLLWPQYTKAQFIEYYYQASQYILPYLKDRPISMVRYPNGINGKHFYQKDRPQGAPDWIRTFPVYSEDSGKIIEYLLLNDLPALIWVANLAAIELNPWHSRYTSPNNPDWTVIDLDPAEPSGFNEARKAALLARDVLSHLKITGYPKLSGATGIHIYLRLPTGFSYSQSAKLTGFIGKLLLNLNSHLITTERRVKNRDGKVYVDHLQNLKGQTIVAPYSLRPRSEAPISMPITWDELKAVEPKDFTIETFSQRIKRLGRDPFLGLLDPLSPKDVENLEHVSMLASSAEIANI